MFNGPCKSGLCLLVALVAMVSGCAAPGDRAGSNKGPSQLPLAYSPEQAEVFAQEGKHAYDRGEVETAIQSWKSAVALNPADAATVNNLALVLKNEHRFAEAAKFLENGLGASPETAELHYNLAVISELYLLQLEKALAHYKRYQQLSGSEDAMVAGWIVDLERRLQ
ncbi:tetratricopeptide repeat protein [Marinobacter litoralis]|uniref:tetratricopeptide repeat protein n=1 Tax=Marinobacter litoralis TaxID=187981 RepID=UPI0018EE42FB|nr:tetratricopeptide repeat protein [Marinobacter litoralis]MBJ6137725.1 tetratricopeptide repeat protein [Marinobacter litoralis]